MKTPIRVVLAGCGSISNSWMKAVAKEPESIEMVGLVDLIDENMEGLAEKFLLNPIPKGNDLVTMIRETRPDVVFDCTVPSVHTEITSRAVENGCHVLGEKPLADSMNNARKSIRAAESAGKTYAVIQNRRYNTAIRTLISFLETGTIGKIHSVMADFYIGAHFGGFREKMSHPLILDMAIHTFDQARFITGANATSVYCHEFNPVGSWYKEGASAQCIFEMTEGIIFNYRGSWCGEGFHTPWECTWRIVGTKGTVMWDGTDQIQAQVVSSGGEFTSKMNKIDVPIESSTCLRTSHYGVIMDFIESIQDGGKPLTHCTDNIHSLAMVFGSIESAERGRKVSIGPDAIIS